jgi:hypothetical protein
MCVVHEGRVTDEGLGSYFQLMKPTIIVSQALGAEIALTQAPDSSHGYNVAGLFEFGCRQVQRVKTPACTVSSVTAVSLIPSICHGAIGRAALIEQLGVGGCQTVWLEVAFDAVEDLNDCAASFYRQKLLRIREAHYRHTLRPYLSSEGGHRQAYRCVNVGVHIRFMSGLADNVTDSRVTIGPGTELDHRSISLEHIGQALQNVRPLGCPCVSVYLYVKDSPVLLAGVLPSKFSVVDSGDDVADLLHFMQNDVLIMGVSSWSVLGAFASRGKLVITDRPGSDKHSQRYKLLNKVFHHSEVVAVDCGV